MGNSSRVMMLRVCVKAFNPPVSRVSKHGDIRIDATPGAALGPDQRREGRAPGEGAGATYTARHMIGARRVSSSGQFAGNARDAWSNGSHVAHAPSTRWLC